MPLSLRQITEKRGDASFAYMNETVNIVYRADRITKEFRAEALRLNREVLKAERRLNHLLETVNMVIAPDGSIEAAEEDEAAQAAIRDILINDERLKREIDNVVASILLQWDVIDEETGKMIPIFNVDPVTKQLTPSEQLCQTPADFEGAILSAILNQNEVGEAQGATPSNNSLSTLKQVERQVTSRPVPIGMRTSKHRGTSRR